MSFTGVSKSPPVAGQPGDRSLPQSVSVTVAEPAPTPTSYWRSVGPFVALIEEAPDEWETNWGSFTIRVVWKSYVVVNCIGHRRHVALVARCGTRSHAQDPAR